MPSSYTNLLYHVVFSTKNRQPFLQHELQEELYRYIGGILRSEGGIQVEIGGVPDHVHILMRLKPTQQVSQVLNKIKANSSKWINDHQKVPTKFVWQEGYGAFSVSESQVDSVRGYIQNQAEHHRRRTFREELEALLERYGVVFDPEQLWN